MLEGYANGYDEGVKYYWGVKGNQEDKDEEQTLTEFQSLEQNKDSKS